MGFYEKWMQTFQQTKNIDHHQPKSSERPAPEDSKLDVILPRGCPLNGGGGFPPECCFEAPIFHQLICEQVLPFADGGCPLVGACRSKKMRFGDQATMLSGYRDE